jgi:hypothetical protein
LFFVNRRRSVLAISTFTIVFLLVIIISADNASGFVYDLSSKLSTTINAIIGLASVGNSNNDDNNDNNGNNSTMMSGLMNEIPKDIIIKVKSSQIIPVGRESEIVLLVLDKSTEKPLRDAQVIIGIERGASMTTMDMVGPMFEAIEEQTNSSLHLVKFTPDSKGIYTMHVHVIPNGESMHSMMENHLDIGLIAKDNF